MLDTDGNLGTQRTQGYDSYLLSVKNRKRKAKKRERKSKKTKKRYSGL